MADEVVIEQVPIGTDGRLADDAKLIAVRILGQLDVLPVTRGPQIQVARVDVQPFKDLGMRDGQLLDAVCDLVRLVDAEV